ncbi:MAG: hypothetical protein HY646_21900 [Acidobacteria bacterium]|nr:hypothetical protein [Acidobacteriota bacterium]
MMNAIYLLFGVAFGFLLSAARVTDYNTIMRMFLLEDLYLIGVMMVAMAVAAAGLFFVKRRNAPALIGCKMEVAPKRGHAWVFPAALVFGAGWCLTGT